MFKNLWRNCFRSICSISFYTENGIKINSLTGFRIQGYLVTDEIIYKAKPCEDVVFQFMEEDGCTPSLSLKMSYKDLLERLNRIAEYENEGFALIYLDNLNLDEVPSLTPEFRSENYIGQSIALLGYHGDQENLSLKSGIISSFVKAEDGKRYIQFDAIVKQGNSGSPIIDSQTGNVLGVVGFRLSTITQTYEAFKNIIDENLKLLKKSEGKMNILDIDPIQVLIANQNQLKQISREFYRTSMINYGFAHEIYSLVNYLEEHTVTVPKKKKEKV